MIVPVLVGLHEIDAEWPRFLITMLFGAFIGGILLLSNHRPKIEISARQGFVLVALCWILLPFYAALPFLLSSQETPLADSVFEAVSGLTTTGATVFDDVESLSPALLIWRAILQWLGGIGVIAMAFTVMPLLRIGGMQLFLDAVSSADRGIAHPGRQIAALTEVYCALTFLCCLCYFLSGMSLFDAAAHAMSTVSTGGFSTYDDSIGHFSSLPIELVATVFMIAGSLPFVLYLRAVNGNVSSLWRDGQARWFLGFCAIGTILIAFGIPGIRNPWEILHEAGFTTISFLSGTGFTITSYSPWAPSATALLFFMVFAGGCSGSTTGGIRIFRFQILYATMAAQLRQLLYPSGIFIPNFQGAPLSVLISVSVLGFFFAFTIAFVLLSCLLALAGLDPMTALSAAASALSNAGAGLGPVISPGGSFAPLDGVEKWLLIAGMIVGRLEVLPLLVLFSAHFRRP